MTTIDEDIRNVRKAIDGIQGYMGEGAAYLAQDEEAALERVLDAAAGGDQIERREEWCQIPYGVLGRRGPMSDQRFSTKADLLRGTSSSEDDDPYGWTPARCEVVTIDGHEYRSYWILVPTQGQLAEHPHWPTELELTD